MDEAATIDHLCYEKGELQTKDDVIQEDNLETICNATGVITDSHNQHDYSVDLHLNADFPIKPERRTSVVACNTAEIFGEDDILEAKNWEQKYCDQNDYQEKDNFLRAQLRAQEPYFSNYRTNEISDLQEELANDIAAFHESPQQADKQSRHDLKLFDHDSGDNDNECGNNYPVDNNCNTLDSILITRKNDELSSTSSPANNMPNSGQLSMQISGNNDSVITATNDCQDESDDNLKNVLTKEYSSEDSLRKHHDAKKISDMLEAFNKNNEESNISMKILRSKIEETEMPTKGVVSNLKSLFENNAINSSNNVTCKSANYKLEYGVGRSSGTLNKGIFH